MSPPNEIIDAPRDKARLLESLEDAEILVQHAARCGRDFPDRSVSVVLRTRANLNNGSRDVETEEEFWKTFKELSNSLKPATVEGIRETRPYNSGIFRLVYRYFSDDRSTPAAHVSVVHYTVLAVFLVLLVVVIQAAMAHGSLILGNITQIESKATKNERAESISGDEVREIVAANIVLLKKFNWWVNFGMTDPEAKKFEVIELATASILKFNGFLLPLLVGSLGAVAQILRSLAQQIREDSYSSGGRIEFRVRLVLGLLAGTAVGMLFGNHNGDISAGALSIGPLALPFIAGYSIEFFFSAIDRVIDAFKK